MQNCQISYKFSEVVLLFYAYKVRQDGPAVFPWSSDGDIAIICAGIRASFLQHFALGGLYGLLYFPWNNPMFRSD